MSPLDGMQMFRLFDESNFVAYDKQRYSAVLEAGLAHNGLELDDVLAVTDDLGLWAICRPGVFRADLRGIFKKRIECGDLITHRQIEEAQVKPTGPHTSKIVLSAADGRKLGEINFRTGGPEATRDRERAQCRRVIGILEAAWRAAS
jgi:hypothetical protein